MKRKLVPDVVKSQELILVPEDTSVLTVSKLMAEKNIGAVLVVNHGALVGIVTERDLNNKVLSREIDPFATEVSEIMTRDPDTLPPDADATEALALMHSKHYRHLPITQGKRAVGIVSVRDLFKLAYEHITEEAAA
ncbi:CBS domain-containing protein [Azospirillum soli]|uniref:CBS domain-containing protein n=1 Tax=Azospirillum soli TaxID=1304799 RepID=UPI001AE4460B|nr:CBS domain-containing protein [Azospirillum soli]MBP2311438.1 CBS domain-containing protein [Azospirillum soli]